MIYTASITIHTFSFAELAGLGILATACIFQRPILHFLGSASKVPATNLQNGPRASSPGCKAEKRGDKLLHATASVVCSGVRVSNLIPVVFSNLFSREIYLWTHTKNNVYQRVLHILEVARLNAQSARYCTATAGHHQGSS